MTQNTENVIKAVIAGDPTITPEMAQAALDVLAAKPTDAEDGDRVISRAEVAAIMGKSVKAVDIYGRRGIIRRVYLTGGGERRAQAQGYSRKSVLEAIRRGTRAASGKRTAAH